jgi:hypothetical protein
MNGEGLTQGAQKELERKIEDYIVVIVSQAGLSESRNRKDGISPEITASHIAEADWMCRRGLIRKKISKKSIWLRISQLIGSTVIGVGASNIKETYGVALTIIGFMVAVLAYVFELEDNRDS